MTLRKTAHFFNVAAFIVDLLVYSSYLGVKRDFEYQLKNFTKKKVNTGIHSCASVKLI